MIKRDSADLLTIYSGSRAVVHEIELGIIRADFVPDYPLAIFVDNPYGFALNKLERFCPENAVVVTDNPCPEYWDDLWDLNPQVLLAGGHSFEEFIMALSRASAGDRYRKTPHYESDVTERERAVMRLCAKGKTNAEIANALDIREKTVKNHLSSVFSKLGLVHRGEVSNYYWGLWMWLPDRKNVCE